MAWNEASDIVNGHNDYIEYLPMDLQERIREYWEDMLTDDDNQLIDDVHCYILENIYDDNYRQEWMADMVDNSDAEWCSRYFDYEAYGRDVVMDGQFYETEKGFIEIL
jgi:hypothetical protein